MIHTVRRIRRERWQPPALVAVLNRIPAPRGWIISHLFPTLLVMLVTFRWYEPGTFIAAGDVGPFLRDSAASELTSLWNHQVTGGGSTSTQIVLLPEIMLIHLVRFFGGSELLAQQIFFTAGFGFSAFGTAHLARVVVRSRGAIAVAGIVGALNPFHLLQLPNPLFMVAVGSIGLIAGELLGHLAGRKTTATRLTAASLPYAYLATNPALLALSGVAYVSMLVVAARFAPRERVRSLGRVVLKASPWVVGLHLWWLVPTAIVLGLGLDGADISVATQVDQWSWSHVQNSLPNLITLTAHWGWTNPEIFPWAASLDRFPGSLSRWALPLGALAAPFVARPRIRNAVWTMVGLVGVTVFLSKGLHAPGAGINRFLYQHLPGFWLLREPVSKVGPFQVLLYATLFAITIERLIGMAPVGMARLVGSPDGPKVRGRTEQREVPLGQLAAVGLVLIAVSFPWPLLTGSVMADERGSLQSIHTVVPADWFEIADAINASEVDGKVLVLPVNDFYQVTTTWGYHGADLVPQQLLDRPMIQRYPGGYFDLSSGFGGILERIEYELVDGSPDRAARLLASLGVSHVVHRLDVVSGAVHANLADNSLLEAGLGQTPGLRQSLRRDVAVVYEVQAPEGLFTVNTRTVATRGDTNDVAESVSRLVPGEVVVDQATEADALVWMSESFEDVFPFDLATDDRFEVLSAPGRRTIFASAAPSGPGDPTWTISLDDRSDLEINGSELQGAEAVVAALPGEPLALSVDGRIDIFEQDLGVTVDLAEPITVFTAAGASELDGFTDLGDCDNQAPQLNETLVLSAVRTGAGSVELGANDHSACVSVDLPRSAGATLVEFEFRTGSEDSGRFCLWDLTARSCVVDERLERTPEWERVRAAATFDPTHDYQLFVYAVARKGEPVRVEYTGLTFQPLTGHDFFLVPEAPTSVDLLAGGNVMTSRQPEPASLLGPFGDLADCHQFDDRTAAEAGLSLVKSGSSVTLGANQHSACTWSELDVVSNRLYELSFDFRTQQGSAPRFCVWMIGQDRCAEVPGLAVSSDWQTYRAEFELPIAASGADLYLYADGGETPDTTLVDFRDVSVIPSPRRFVQLERAVQPDRSAPEIAWSVVSPGAYDVTVTDAAGSFVLSFAESYSSSWAFDALPAGWTARQLESNGYGNTWIIDGTGDGTLALRFGPNGVALRAQYVSLVVLLLAIVYLGWMISDRQRNRKIDAMFDEPERRVRRTVEPDVARRIRAGRERLSSTGGSSDSAR